MKATFDTTTKTATLPDGSTVDLFGKEAFDVLAKLWVSIGWVRKYSYGFSWLGRPIIQLPDDMVRIQEAIFVTKPDVIIETGVAHGGSLIYYASLFDLIGNGRVIGVDIEIRPHNRAAIEAHPLIKRISLVEGDSISNETVDRVRDLIKPGEKVMVILDSNHLKDHVLGELNAYADFVSPGCYLLAQDGVMQDVAGMPRTSEDWVWNNPRSAVAEFLAQRPDFKYARAARPFDETLDTPECSHHPDGWLIRT